MWKEGRGEEGGEGRGGRKSRVGEGGRRMVGGEVGRKTEEEKGWEDEGIQEKLEACVLLKIKRGSDGDDGWYLLTKIKMSDRL